jgi:N-acetylglucosamine-6-phosphate deacetylase
MLRAKGPGRSILVSDAAALAHCPPGEYRTPVGGAVTVGQDGSLRLTGTRLGAGSGSSLTECLRWAVRHTALAQDELLSMATDVPARLLGLTGRGRIAAGERADLVVLDADLEPTAVLVGGEQLS